MRESVPIDVVMLVRRLALALIATVLAPWSGAAEERDPALPLPRMEACRHPSHPLLPSRWHGTYLMAPFTHAQLTLGDVVYDGTIPAMRVRLYGLRHGSADLLVTERNTYLLGRDEASGEACANLGDTGWRPLPRDWLADDAQCTGSAPVAEMPVDWWKTPADPAPSADWIWYRTGDGSPFRLMFARPGDRLAVLSRYAFSYQVRFETLPESDLAGIATRCQAAARRPSGAGRAALDEILDGMARSPSNAAAQIARLMPEIDATCPATPLPSWPDTLGMTTFMTPLNFNYSPFPTEVLYDWNVKSQRTRMFWPARSRLLTEDALLLGSRGFSVARLRSGRVSCRGSLPGAPRSNWTETAPCSCEAVVNGTTALTPYGTARIMVCPMTAPRVVWTWYALGGRPMVFMETSAAGDETTGLLTLADYYAWVPNQVAGNAVFAKPAQCRPGAADRPSPNHAMQAAARPCDACHLGSSDGR